MLAHIQLMKSLSQSPTDLVFVQNPYVFYDRARAFGPVFRWHEYDMVCATSHEAVSSLLRDRRLGREIPTELAPSVPAHLTPFYDIESHSMLELEPPKHTRLRKLVLSAFTSSRTRALGPSIQKVCHDLIDNFPSGSFDLIEAYGRHVPVLIICDLLGIQRRYAQQLLNWSNAMVAMYQAKSDTETELRAATASVEFSLFLREQFSQKRRSPKSDLLSELITASDEGDRLSEDELISTVILLLNAGHEATVHTIGNSVATLLSRGITEINSGVVEEALRFNPPLHMFTRWVYQDFEAYGHAFQRGDQVGCLLAAANRDPVTYNDPNAFDPQRSEATNTSFGGGIHFCVGAPLARLELLISLKILFERCPTIRMAGDPQFANVYHFHGLERLDVRL